MTPFDPPTRLTEAEKQFLRDNKNSEFMRVVKKVLRETYEDLEAGYLRKGDHDTSDLLVLKGEKLAIRGIFNLLSNHASELPEKDARRTQLIPTKEIK